MFLKQSTAVVIPFGPFEDKTDGVTHETGLVSALDHASTGIMLSKNGGTMAVRHATVTASVYDAHGCYKVTLDTTDTNTLGSLRVIYTDPATCCPVWQDFKVITAVAWNNFCATSGGSLPNAAADAAGGLPISDTGGLDLDVKLANTNEVTTARMGALTDLIDGGRLDLLVDGIKAKTDNLPSDPADQSLIIAATDAIKGDTAAILVDTGTTLDGRIPAALVGGRMDSSVGAMAANVVTASALATDACDEIVDAVWDEDVDTHHQTAGSAGKKLDDAGGAADPWATALPGAYGAGTAGKIVGDNINATISSRATQTLVDAIAGYVDTEVAAIKAKTDNLPSDPADESLIMAATDAIMSRLGAPAGASIAADIATRATPAQVNTEADTAIADARLNQLLAASVAAPVAGSLFAELTEDDGGVQRFTVNALEQGPGGGSSETRNREGTAQAGGASTITLDAGASVVNDFYKNQRCAIVGGTGSGECEIIASYVGSTKVATMAASWATTPDATSQFRILPLGTIPGASAPTADAVAEATLDKLATQKVTTNTATNELTAYKADGVAVRGVRRVSKLSEVLQGMIPQ